MSATSSAQRELTDFLESSPDIRSCLVLVSVPDAGTIIINALAVPAHLQGKGIGRRVMNGVLDIADQRTMAVRLELSPDALSFTRDWYGRLGFENTGAWGEWGPLMQRPAGYVPPVSPSV